MSGSASRASIAVEDARARKSFGEAGLAGIAGADRRRACRCANAATPAAESLGDAAGADNAPADFSGREFVSYQGLLEVRPGRSRFSVAGVPAPSKRRTRLDRDGGPGRHRRACRDASRSMTTSFAAGRRHRDSWCRAKMLDHIDRDREVAVALARVDEMLGPHADDHLVADFGTRSRPAAVAAGRRPG